MRNNLKFTKKILPGLLLLLVLVTCHSANATNYYIAANGNDANNGTSTSTPWKTISKLNSFFSSLKPGDNVLFNRGDVFYGTITINRSGSSGSPITISAYGTGANPVVTGFTSVTSWTNLGSNIWESSSSVSSLSSCNMVAINGVATAMGRYPNSGYLTYQSVSGNTSITSSSIGSTNWTGAEAVIRKNNWTLDRCAITSQSGATLYYSDPYTSDNGTANYGFFIQNDSRTLDAQNEWYYNPSTKKIRIYSTSTPSGVQVATVSNLIYSGGGQYITIDNIAFKGSSADAIYLNSNSNNCYVQNCAISLSGLNGIMIQPSTNVVINNNTIDYCNGGGIINQSGNGFSITNNVITNIGVVVGQAPATDKCNGIYTAGSNVSIRYNTIRNIAKNGVYFSYTGGGIVQYNLIDGICAVLDDGAGVYALGVDATLRTIDHNIFLNPIGNISGTPNTATASEGIFLDEFASNVTVSNNTIANSVNYAAIKSFKGHDNTIINNTCFNNYFGIYLQDANGSSPGNIYNFTVKNNIFVARTNVQYVYGIRSVNNNILNFGTADSNYYARPIDDNVDFYTFQTSTGYVYRNLSGWQSFTGKDAHSKKSPKTITTVNDLRFEYNASSSSKTITLDGNYIDVKNTSYNGSITLAPYTSAVLIRNGAATNQAPKANAGSDQTITLPTNTVTLSGSGTDADGSITAYSWTEASGPSSTSITNATASSTGVTSLVQGVYQFVLKVTDNASATGTDTVQITVNAASGGNLLPAVNPSNTVNGMNYSYYESSIGYPTVPNFSSLTPVKTGNASNFDISSANRSTNFAFNFTGYINVPSDGQYTFYTSSDDGSLLYIDNVLVVNNDGLHGTVEKSGTIGLKAGKHTISVGYTQQGGGVTLNVSYSGPGISKQPVPPSTLYIVSNNVANGLLPAVNPSNTVNGLDYGYYESSTGYSFVPSFSSLVPVKTGTATNFDISPANRSTNFSFYFTGFINVPSDGQYVFYTNSDDGSLLFIDGVLVVNNNGLHGLAEKSGAVGLQAGKHAISVGYIQEGGGATLNVNYSGPGISKQAVLSSALYRILTSGSNILAVGNSNGEVISSSSGLSIKAFPNPFLDNIEVNIDDTVSGEYKLVLTDPLGRVIWRITGNKTAGTLQKTINTSSLQRGIYFLKVIQSNKSTVIQLVK